MKLWYSLQFSLFIWTTRLKCYQCDDTIDGWNFDAAKETTCNIPPEAEFCFTHFEPNNIIVNHLECGKEICLYKTCNPVSGDGDFICK